MVLADSDLFGDDCIDQLDHRALWLNLCYWATGGRRAAEGAARTTGDRARSGLAETARARRTPWPCSRLRTARWPATRSTAGQHVAEIIGAIETLAPRFPHQAEYLEAVVEDLRAWEADGFRKPDFTRSLEAFRPERERRDGIEHLVFFPMYKQNGSRDTCCEALLVRVPWPDWIAELERTRYDNPKYVPVELIDSTRGYDSECAVLFPETVSVAGRPVNNFGAIFCDREAARLRRIAGAAADLLGHQPAARTPRRCWPARSSPSRPTSSGT